jgi:hypothetical protein
MISKERKMMETRRMAPFALALALTALAAGSGAQSWDAGLPATLDKIVADYWQPNLLTAFGDFTFEDSRLPSPFSRYLEEALASAIPRTKSLRLFNKAAAAAMDPAFRKVYGEFFETNGVDALLFGRYYDEGSSVRVRLEITGLSDGVLIGTVDLTAPKSSIPARYPVSPTAAAQSTASSLGGLAPDALSGTLSVSVSTDRGPGAVYREGERMTVLVTVSKSAWLKVYHVDATGSLKLIWPNAFTPGQRVDPGVAIRIPGEGDRFSFLMTPPFGTEFIKVVASTQSFALDESSGATASSPFADLGSKDIRGSITRGIAVTASGKAERAEATASYEIIAK